MFPHFGLPSPTFRQTLVTVLLEQLRQCLLGKAATKGSISTQELQHITLTFCLMHVNKQLLPSHCLVWSGCLWDTCFPGPSTCWSFRVLSTVINTPILTHRLYFLSCTPQLSKIIFMVAWLFMRLCWLLGRKLNWDCLEWYCYWCSLFPIITSSDTTCNPQA